MTPDGPSCSRASLSRPTKTSSSAPCNNQDGLANSRLRSFTYVDRSSIKAAAEIRAGPFSPRGRRPKKSAGHSRCRRSSDHPTPLNCRTRPSPGDGRIATARPRPTLGTENSSPHAARRIDRLPRRSRRGIRPLARHGEIRSHVAQSERGRSCERKRRLKSACVVGVS